MRKSITTVVVACGLILSAFSTSSAMAGSVAIGIIGAGANFATTGYEEETTGSADGKGGADSEKNYAPDQDANVLYGAIFAES